MRRNSYFTRVSVAKYAMAGLLLFGGAINSAFAMQAAASQTEAGVTEVTAINPDPSASQETRLESLSKIEVTFDSSLEMVNGAVSIKTLGDDEPCAKGSISLNDKVMTITLYNKITTYGTYMLTIPAGTVKTADGKTNEQIDLIYQVGTFEPVSVLPAIDKAVASLKEVTVFMSDRVGGVLDGAKLNVYKDGDTEEAYTTATIDFLNSNANEVTITLADEVTEYGKYTIVVPAAVIFDKYYNGEDAFMSGATGNEAFELTYQVGTFEPVSVLPAMDKAIASLKEVTIFMSDRVGGVLDGAKLNVYKDGDTEEAYTTATIDFLNSNANEVTITLAEEIKENGTYTIEVPAAVIFDKYYNGEDAFMSGATGNEAFTLTYTVDTATAISSIVANGTDKTIFNLNGVRLEKAVKGINIINGKKVIIRK